MQTCLNLRTDQRTPYRKPTPREMNQGMGEFDAESQGSYEGEEERSSASSDDEMMQAAPRIIGYEFSDQSSPQQPQRAKTLGQQKDIPTQ